MPSSFSNHDKVYLMLSKHITIGKPMYKGLNYV